MMIRFRTTTVVVGWTMTTMMMTVGLCSVAVVALDDMQSFVKAFESPTTAGDFHRRFMTMKEDHEDNHEEEEEEEDEASHHENAKETTGGRSRGIVDWSSKVNRLKHPSQAARRRARLLLEEQQLQDGQQRELGPPNPNGNADISEFEENTLTASELYKERLQSKPLGAYVNYPYAELPFGEGPGALPNYPRATKDFWMGEGGPEELWEVLACPLYDVTGFLLNPLQCVFGDNEDSSLADIILDAGTDTIGAAMKTLTDKAMVPIAVEAIFQFTGLAYLEKMFEFVCKIVGAFDFVKDAVAAVETAVNAIKGVVNKIEGVVNDVFGAIESLNPFRRRELSEVINGGELVRCEVHAGFCLEREVDFQELLGKDGCDACLRDYTKDEQDETKSCGGCMHCWREFGAKEFGENLVKGLCLPTTALRDNHLIPNPDPEKVRPVNIQLYLSLQLTLSVLESRKLTENVILEVEETCQDPTEAPTKAPTKAPTTGAPTPGGDTPASRRLGSRHGDVLSKQAAKLFDDIDSLGLSDEEVKVLLDRAFGAIINGTPTVRPDEDPSTAGAKTPEDSENPKKGSSVPNLDDLQETRKAAASLGLSEEQMAQILGTLQQEGVSAAEPATKKTDKEVIKKLHAALSQNPQTLNSLDGYLSSKVPQMAKDNIGPLADLILKIVVNKDTNEIDMDKLHKLPRRLETSLEQDCNDVVDDVIDFIKGEIIKPVISGLLEGTAIAFGEIDTVLGDSGESIDKALEIPYLLFSSFETAILETALGEVVKMLQTIAGHLTFGCDVHEDPSCPKLPSMDVDGILTKMISIGQNRAGDLFLTGACKGAGGIMDELAWYTNIFTIINIFLGEAKDSIIEFFNAPIAIIKAIMEFVKTLFGIIDNACTNLNGKVSFASAAYENSRNILQEVACRASTGTNRNKGAGCDGIDNDCNAMIDECAEDGYPPEINVDLAVEFCARGQVFPDAAAAIACVRGHSSATDDCLADVDLQVEIVEGPNSCDQTIVVVATALGCGMRDEDTSMLEIPNIKIGENGETCGFKYMKGYGCDGIDNNWDRTVDECAEDVFPPEVQSNLAKEVCGSKFFPDAQAAVDCIAELVEATDDCLPVKTQVTAADQNTCKPMIIVTSTAQGCGNRDPEDTTIVSIPVLADGDAPEGVGCTVNDNVFTGNGAGVYKSIGFALTEITDNCSDEINVNIEVLSNEFVDAADMVMVSTGGDDLVPSIFVEDTTCKTGQSGKCKISNPKKSREYVIRVSATDEAGNVSSGQCSKFVGTEASAGSPLFLLATTNIVLPNTDNK